MMQGNVDSSYQLPVDESGMMHIRLLKYEHVPGTAEVIEEGNTHKLDILMFERMEKSSAFSRISDKQVILHDGRKADTRRVPTAAKNEEGEKKEEQQAELENLKAQYEELTGKKPGNKKAETLQKEIEEIQKGE